VLGIYLTPHGTLASLKEKYSPLSYGTVCEIVEDILESRASRLSPDVKMSMQHYVWMVRRHVVGDSEIVRLSRDIYQKHKRAFDFIYEHRPDVQAQIRPIVEDLISEHPRLEPDASRKDNIKFVVGEWDNAPALLTAEGWTQSGRILIFEVWNAPSSLDLHLYMGPGPEAIRQNLLEMVRANPNVFKMPSGVKGRWLRIFSRPLLKQEAYENLEQEEREEELHREWERFLERDLPGIEAALQREAWIWEPVKSDEKPTNRLERFVWVESDMEITKRPEDEE
jgi:hypothetical protein